MLRSRLPRIPAEIEARLEAATAQTAQRVAEAARGKVPVATGTLRDAIHLEPNEHGGVFVVAGNTEAFYGHLVEYGTAFTEARPFLLPAAEENRQEHAKNARQRLRGL